MTINSGYFTILMQADLVKRLPTFEEIVKYYGPYLGLIIALVIVILILQFVWFKRIVRAKDDEIKRLSEREQVLNDRILSLIDKEIGYKKHK